MSGYQYTFVVQCKELLNHAQSKVISTCRIENDNGVFMAALESLNRSANAMKSIPLDDIDLGALLTKEEIALQEKATV
jgi:hypothetical protein